jgi:hypothetical protein
VDLANARITLRAETIKTKTARHIPLNSAALALLRDWHEQGGAHPLPLRLVFGNPTTGKRLVTIEKA